MTYVQQLAKLFTLFDKIKQAIKQNSLSYTWVEKQLTNILHSVEVEVVRLCIHEVWKTITFPSTPCAQGITKEILEKDSFYLTGATSETITYVNTYRESEGVYPSRVHLYRMTGAQLGFTNPVSYLKIRDKAKLMGFVVCPMQTALELRRQYPTHNEDETLRIGLPVGIDCIDGHVNITIFVIGHDSRGQYLDVEKYTSEQEVLYNPSTVWIFTKE